MAGSDEDQKATRLIRASAPVKKTLLGHNAGTSDTVLAGDTELDLEPPEMDEELTEGSLITERYRVKRIIGAGAMGAVYEAEHTTLEKPVAIKVLHSKLAGSMELEQRFLREAKAATRISNDNIVDVIDFGRTDDGALFLVMELLEGESLMEAIEEAGALPWIRSRHILIQICKAVAAAHRLGIIHRDMKPESVLLVEREGMTDYVKLLDFGIARVGEADERLTKTGMVLGTALYMSPEQGKGDKVDERGDVYSVGCIMYQMLTGVVPFSGDSFMKVIFQHTFSKADPLRKTYPDGDFPASAEAIVEKAMAKEVEDRYQSMLDMVRALRLTSDVGLDPEAVVQARMKAREDEEDEEGVTDTMIRDDAALASEARGARPPLLWIGLALVAAAVAAVVFWASRKESPASPPAPVTSPKPASHPPLRPDAVPPAAARAPAIATGEADAGAAPGVSSKRAGKRRRRRKVEKPAPTSPEKKNSGASSGLKNPFE